MSTLPPLAALLGGVLTLFAPCSIMVLPAFFAYAFQSKRALAWRTLLFWWGLLAALIPLGALVGAASHALRESLPLITALSALLLIILGTIEALGFSLPRFRRTSRLAAKSRDRTHPLSIFLLGAGYGFAGIGCAGPILGGVLVAAGLGGSPLQGALLMACYASGMALPLGLLALIWRSARLFERPWMRPRPLLLFGRETTWTNLLSGLLLVIFGVLLLVSGTSNPLSGLVSPARLASWEESVLSFATLVPSWALIVALAAVLGAAWYIRPRSLSRSEEEESE
ncbi:cytochrome c biogenesis CcdA family protein [Schaalia cardiffensis]